jgi:ABC-type branched-subunit amino acid transport system ATPase component
MLEVDKISLSYGKHAALIEVSMQVSAGETVAILGANGAGKSSLLRTITGLTRRGSGRISFDGKDISREPPHRVVELGIALVPEGRRLIGNMTVMENLLLGAYAERARATEARTLEYVFDLFPRLSERRSQAVRTMSGGEQQMVAIARALMSNPTLLLLDEPSLGLAPSLVEDVFEVLTRISRGSRLGIILVEQNANQALAMSDRAYLLAGGRIVGEGKASELRDDPIVAKSYLGM